MDRKIDWTTLVVALSCYSSIGEPCVFIEALSYTDGTEVSERDKEGLYYDVAAQKILLKTYHANLI